MNNLSIVLLFLTTCFSILTFLIIYDITKRKKSFKKSKPIKPKTRRGKIVSYNQEQINKLASECKLVSDRLNTLLAISSIDCTGKTIQQQLEEISDLVSLRFRKKDISISCSINVSLPSYSSIEDQTIHVASKNHNPASKIAISEDLIIRNKFVGKIQIHTLNDSDLVFLEGEKPFLRSVSRVVSKVMSKMISQTKLQEKLKLFRDILDSSAVITLLLDEKFHIVFHNRALKELTGWTFKDFKKKSFFDIIEVETGQDIREIKDQEVSTFISTVKHKNGSLSRVIWDVSKLETTKLLLVGRDITREFNLRSKTIKSQQEVYLERIAKAVANDLNNCLTTITTQMELILTEKKKLTKKKVDSLLSSIQECSKIADRLLSLTRIRTTDDNLNLSNIIEELVFKLEVPEHINLSVQPEDDLVCKINESQLAMIINNLVVNSIEANSTDIQIHLSKEIIPLEEVDGSLYSGIYVKLSVIDNGCGIKEEDLSKVFEPYYSTKRSLGLGLTIVRKIANTYNGFVTILSKLGSGTTVNVFLPKSNHTIKSLKDCRILLIDDDKIVSEVVRKLLKNKNIETDIASNADEALDLCLKNEYDIIMLDIVLPDIKGLDLLQKLKELQPDTRIIVCSGYPDTELESKDYNIDYYLKKPFEVPELFQALEQVLRSNV